MATDVSTGVGVGVGVALVAEELAVGLPPPELTRGVDVGVSDVIGGVGVTEGPAEGWGLACGEPVEPAEGVGMGVETGVVVGWPMNIFGFLTARATQLKLISAGAGLLSIIVKPLVLLFSMI